MSRGPATPPSLPASFAPLWRRLKPRSISSLQLRRRLGIRTPISTRRRSTRRSAAKGKANGGVYQFDIPRANSIKMEGMAIPPTMGTAIAVNFQPTGVGKAAITRDFVALSSELNPLITALRDNGI
jgi:Domain of Unknown Function (DUF1259)